MTALPADIQSATRPGGVTLATEESSAVLAAFPNARDGGVSLGFFDTLADAAAANAERFALLSVARRRFRTAADRDLPDLRAGSPTVTVTAIDAEVAANGPFLVARALFDPLDDRTEIEIYG